MAQRISAGLSRKQEEEKLKKKGLGLPGLKAGPGATTQVPVIGGRAGMPDKMAMVPRQEMYSGQKGEMFSHQSDGGLPERKEDFFMTARLPRPEGAGVQPAAPTAAIDPEAAAMGHAGLGGLLEKPAEIDPGAGTQPGVAEAAPAASGIYKPEYPSEEITPAPGAQEGVVEPSAVGVPAKVEKGGLNKQALNKALLVAGLTMVDRGGRTYDRPTSATSVVAQGGLAGVGAYDQEKALQQKEAVVEQGLEKGAIQTETARQALANQPLKTEAAKLAIEKEKIALQGAKISQRQKAKLNTLLDALATETDPTKFADLEKRYRAMAGKSTGGKSSPMQQVKEKVKIGVDVLGEPLYEEKTVGAFDTGTGAVTRFSGEQGRGLPAAKKGLDMATARSIMSEAGGDRDKARKLAKERGYIL
ncbi:MAG: hypothetical protein KAV87_37305 [Desulfobacteraceae bacterium]|nr:hypothetical protein [Desulfobacteraceae bacterium]